MKDSNLLSLHMIVKDESQRIRETLESVKPHIDSWNILDTGSTDGTQSIIKDVFENISGELYEAPIITYENTGYIDYAETRNYGLQLIKENPIFILLLNGDDILKNGQELRKFCKKHENVPDEAYFLKIVGENRGEYDSIRLIKKSANLKYKMPTHEVLCANFIKTRVEKTSIFHIEDPLEKRIARWNRDVIILQKYLHKNPNDARTTFYLGQTFECLGQHGEAFQYYDKCSNISKWNEEIYESIKRKAQNAEILGLPWIQIQQYYLEAHAILPHRMEVIYKIAKHYYNEKNYALAYLFALRGLNAEVPENDILFIDREIYEWRLADIISCCAYYIGEKDMGRIAANKAQMAKNDMRLRRNCAFYAHSLKEISTYKDIQIKIPIENIWTETNPSVCIINGQRSAIIRSVNYRISGDNYKYTDGSGIIKTQNWWVNFDENYNIIYQHKIQDLTNIEKFDFPIEGFEDCRPFWWKNKYYASCTTSNLNKYGMREVTLLELNENYDIIKAMPLRGKWSANHQKNWKPAIIDNVLKWIYSTKPLIVLNSLNDDIDACPGLLLGNSQAIYLENYEKWLWIDHEITINTHGKEERIYLHRFVLANKELTEIVSISEAFYFRRLGIEFCVGLALDGKNIVISFGVRDNEAWLAFVPIKDIMSLLAKSINNCG